MRSRTVTTMLLLVGGMIPAVGHGLVQLPRPLTAAEVECNALQLRELLFRSGAQTADFDKRVDTLLTYDAQGPTGVSYSQQLNSGGSLAETPEHWLRFSFRSPAPGRLRVFRRDALSDLVDPVAEARDHVTLVLAPALPPTFQGPRLRIDNGLPGTASSPLAVADAAALVTACHSQLTAVDYRMFSLLLQMLRPHSYLIHPNFYRAFGGVTIYRGQEATPIPGGGMRVAYRVDLYSDSGDISTGPGARSERFALEIVVRFAADGTPGWARMRNLGACKGPRRLHCTTTRLDAWQVAAQIVRPAGKGRFFNPDFTQSPRLCADAALCKPVVFDFAERLAGGVLRE